MAEQSKGADVPKIASDNLSQLVARILNQLSLSAWLPASFLVLMVALILRLATAATAAAASEAAADDGPLIVLGAALGKLGSTSPRAIVLMIAAVVVLTMLTQSFAFESIRVLEGYWGVSRLSQRIAAWRCNHFTAEKTKLEKRRERVVRAAWRSAKREIARERVPKAARRTRNMLAYLGSAVLHVKVRVRLTEDERRRLATFSWLDYAPSHLRREKERLDKRLEDYPSVASNVQPTRLGNILRHFEDQTEADRIESLVEELFHLLPQDLQITHDEQRGRLDLYCSMTFVWATLVVAAVIRFNWTMLFYSLASLVLGAVGAALTYRAAVASARHYGELLLQIDSYRQIEAVPSDDMEEPSAQPRGLGLIPALRRRINYLVS